MNSYPSTLPAEDPARRLLSSLREFARREPTKAAAAAFAAGVIINLLPRKAVASAAAAVGATLLRPALLSLGVVKAVELCFPTRSGESLRPVAKTPALLVDAKPVTQL